jgi:lysozyme family protein
MNVAGMISDILRREGGYVNHPNDRGGPTNWGVTQLTYSRWLGRPASIQEVKDMSQETAKHIYETDYYIAPRIDKIPKELQPLIFDMSINHGPVRAIKILQITLREAGAYLAIDGIVGPKTISYCEVALDRIGECFINAVVENRMGFYKSILDRDPTQVVFIKGWTRRAREFLVPVGQEHALAAIEELT